MNSEGVPHASDQPTATAGPSATGSAFAYGYLAPGQMLGHYEITARIGQGGMGAAYKAVDKLLDRTVAIKVIAPVCATDRDRLRFAREAKVVSALNHPNIVTVYEFNSQDGIDFIAMEFVEGRTLHDILAEHQTPEQTLLGYARHAANGIARAHAAGIVHRDLKPSNIMVTPQGDVKVLDFGLAKREDPEASGDETQLLTLTRAGSVLGTPGYMSPEQAMGEAAGFPADIFSMGVILYQIACGRRPFQGRNAQATLHQIAHEEPPRPAEINPRVRPELAALISRCLSKKPENRPQTMAELAAALGALASTDSVHSGAGRFPRGRTLIAICLLAVAVGAFALWESQRPALPPHAPATVVPGTPLPRPFEYSIEAQKMKNGAPEGIPYTAAATDTFQGGWKFRLRMKPSAPGALYVVNEGPGEQGESRFWILYPARASAPAEAAGAETTTGWYVFDRNPGAEKLWIVFSPEKLETFEKVLRAGTKGLVATHNSVIETAELLAQSVSSARGEKITGEKLELKHQ